jgi:SPP1 gp7 family putative phage head morphogenesis protein
MSRAVTADVEEFPEAAEFFRSRFPVTGAIADALGAYAGPRAWTIAGVAQLDVVLTVWESLLRALEAGTPFADWKREIEDTLTQAWGKRNSPRLETIFRNATSSSYNAGRWRQMNEPAIVAVRPYVMFDGIDDSRQSEICNERDGTIVPLHDAWVSANHPPLHHRCRSSLRNLTEREALRRGVTKKETTTDPQEGFGKTPDQDQWRPDPSKYPRDLFDEYQLKRSELQRQTRRPRLDE